MDCKVDEAGEHAFGSRPDGLGSGSVNEVGGGRPFFRETCFVFGQQLRDFLGLN